LPTPPLESTDPPTGGLLFAQLEDRFDPVAISTEGEAAWAVA